jgi:hypothetical protein
LDLGGSETCRKYIEAARPDHPALIDQNHVLDELFGIVNVPSGVWIDEEGMIVRPPETAWTATIDYRGIEIPPDAPPERVELIELVRRLRIEGDPYVAALRDWVEKGPDSPFALSPDEVVRRSRAQPMEVATAAANFEMASYLHQTGHPEAAVAFFREAHRLQPDNWTYKRQAWRLVDRAQGPTDIYDGSWAEDVKAIGPENYYPPFEP